MTFSEAQYSEKQAIFLKYLDNIGAVTETVILEISGQVTGVYELCEEAARYGMEVLAKRYHTSFIRSNPDLNPSDYFQIKILATEELVGKYIHFKDFIGDYYGVEKGALTMFEYHERFKVMRGAENGGFAKAFLAPPHSLRFERAGSFSDKEYMDSEIRFYIELLQAYLKTILNVNNIAEAELLKIISWSDNWSNYFEAGKEWWGTFCWTILDERSNVVTFIAASSTD
jgi:hypothetical protein